MMPRKARLVCLAVAFLTPAAAQTGVWTSPVALSTGGQGWEAAAAVDGNGNSVAVWDEIGSEAHIWSRAELGAGSWGSVTQVSPGSLGIQTTLVFPAVRISAGGFATAVWTSEDGVWTADRPPTGKWNPAQLLLPGVASPIFVMNSQGDAAVAWTVGGPTDPSSSVMAVLRPAGGAWTSSQTVASGVHITADHAGIGGNGAAVVTWESYTAVCGDGFCELSNYIPHASRQDAGSSAWVDSGMLLGPAADSHNALVALDSSGRAMLVALSGSGAYISATQAASGGAWSPFNTVVDVQGISIVSDLASDNAGDVTMIYEAIGFSTSQALAVAGSITHNAWSAPVVLSGSDTGVGQVYFALAPNGAALSTWLSSSATPEVHAVTRATAAGTWGSPVAVSQRGSSEIAPEAAAVNSAGNAIVIYSGYNAADVHTEYASSYTP
ncbi:MAG TPA: hypothetical protein VN924_05810 [Bryobacteraceae bacterium]|nr:hypothetical protein [Bryobacteraceae bacterium]